VSVPIPDKFRGADLRGADFVGADLSLANFFGANLYGAHLVWASVLGAGDFDEVTRTRRLSKFLSFTSHVFIARWLLVGGTWLASYLGTEYVQRASELERTNAP